MAQASRILVLLLGIGVLASMGEAQTDCLSKFKQCMTPLAQWSDIGESLTTICAKVDTLPDVCSLYEQVTTCFQENLGSDCLADATLKELVDQQTTSKTSVCSATGSCYIGQMKCTCHLVGDELTLDSLRQSVCSGYGKFRSCMDDDIPRKCRDDAEIGKRMEYFDAFIGMFNYLYCPDAGGCAAAMTCLEQLSSPQSSPEPTAPPSVGTGNVDGVMTEILAGLSSTGGIPSPDLPNVCPKLDVFDCLNSASDSCGLDQGDVTMGGDVKGLYTDLCINVMPQVGSLAECNAFTTCLRQFTGVPKLHGDDGTGIPSKTAIATFASFIAGMTRTGFWCSWLEHHYQCALDHIGSCQIGNEANVRDLATQKLAALKETCKGAATAAPPTFDTGTGASTRASLSLVAVAVLLRTFWL